MTKLYFIACIDPIGDNQDLFVEANGTVEAVHLWREYYRIDDETLSDYGPADIGIFLVPDRTGTAQVLPWNGGNDGINLVTE